MWQQVALMLAASMAKEAMIDKPKRDAETKLAAETQRYSPWTGLTAKAPENNFGSNLLQAGITGAMMGQNMEMVEAQKGVLEAQTDLLKTAASKGATEGAAQGMAASTYKTPMQVEGALSNLQRTMNATGGNTQLGMYQTDPMMSINPTVNSWNIPYNRQR